jgi:hypothetical protein
MPTVRQALDRIAAGTLGPALTRPVAAPLRRDSLAALRDERPADAVLARSLAHLEVAGAGAASPPNAGRVGAGGRRVPTEPGPGPLVLPPGAAVAWRQAVDTSRHVETSQETASPISSGSHTQLGAAALPPALRVHQRHGAETTETDDAQHQSATMVTAGATTSALAEHTVADESAIARTMASAARQAVVAPAAVFVRDALERLVRPPAVLELDRNNASAPSTPPTPTQTMSSMPTATATPVRRAAPFTDGRRRPSGLADLAAMYSSTDPADSAAAPTDHVARPLGIDPRDVGGEIAVSVHNESAPPPADDWRLRDSRSRTSPSPAAELSGVAAVLEAVLLHEARRYGVSVEET